MSQQAGDGPEPNVEVSRTVSETLPLLPNRVGRVGLLLFAMGALLGVLRFRFGVRPHFLDARIFALHTSYFDSRSFVWIEKNLTDEVTALLLLVGLYARVFARETDEGPWLDRVRLRAMAVGLGTSGVVLVVSSFTIFGLGFVSVLSANMFVAPIVYLVAFAFMVFRARRRDRERARRDQ